MRFAYADPPYLSCGARYYGHPEWDDQACHLMLVGKLTVDYPDGWALSCRAVDLRWLLPACPEDVHVASWTKPLRGIGASQRSDLSCLGARHLSNAATQYNCRRTRARRSGL